jgi:hypothetical protein
MANIKCKAQARRARLSLDNWTAIAAVLVILLIVVATLPRVRW